MKIQAFHDKETGTFSYVVSDDATQSCAIIDSVLNFDLTTGKLSSEHADKIIAYIHEQNLTVEWILETHVHADHLSAAQYLKQKLGGKLGIGSNIKSMFKYWNAVFHFKADGQQFDALFEDQATFTIGTLTVRVMHTPGHTPACTSYHIDDVIFVGDTLFKPKSGTSRADFPGGSPETLYHSIQKILNLAPDTKIYLCHDYPGDQETATYLTTVQEEKMHNTMISDGISIDEYKQKREARDKTLAAPKLLLPSLQVNLLGGELPFTELVGSHYLKIPVKKSFA